MAQRDLDDSDGSMLKAGIRCPVCKERVLEAMGRHMRSHGDKEYQEYMVGQRSATPSEYRMCPKCQKTFHKNSLTRHISTAHAEECCSHYGEAMTC